MKKQYTRKQIVEAINYWKKQIRLGNYKRLNESLDIDKERFNQILSKLPKDELDFLFADNFSGDILSSIDDFRLITESTIGLNEEMFEQIGNNSFEYDAYDIPIYAETKISGVQVAVFFRKGRKDQFLRDLAEECKTNKHLWYGLKYGLLYFDQTEEAADYIKNEARQNNSLDSVYTDSDDLEWILIRACCPRYDDKPTSSLSEPIPNRICQLAGIKPLTQKELDNMISLAYKIKNEM